MRFSAAVLFALPLQAQTVLVFSKTAGFRHASIPNGIAAVEALGAAGGFDVEATEDAGRFTDEGLAPYYDGTLFIYEWSRNWIKEVKAWTDGEVREVRSDAVTLEADRRYPITLEYYENDGQAQAHLSWSAAGLTKRTVPRTALFSNTALPTDAAHDDVALPRRLDIETIYPNPAAGTTRIRFALPGQADVRLEAFDVLGRRVATLAEGAMQPGTHDVTVDSRALPNGVYVLRLSAGGVVRTRSLVVAR